MRGMFRGITTFDSLTPGVRFILISSVVVYFLQILFPPMYLENLFALHSIGQGFYPWQLVTYAFLHGGGFHLFFNMLVLWWFAPHIESIWGTKTFLKYFYICAIGAGAAHLIFVPNSLAVGASGGIYGLLIAFGFLFPEAIIYMFFVFPAKAKHAVFFMALLTLVSAMSSGGSQIAHFAHLGGLATGYLYLKMPVWWGASKYIFSKFNKGKRSRAPRFEVLSPDDDDLSREVDRILEKISSQGVGSLTAREHKIMKEYGQKKK